MIKLSKRMRMVASMVTAEGILADVGTDHAYVPIALMQEGKIKGAIAMDINEGPLARAKEHIAAAGLESCIQTRLSDGVSELTPGETDSVLIAGMGGELVIHILSEGQDVCTRARELILQPQSEIYKVREYLRENRYQIVDEDMVQEEGKYYLSMKCIFDAFPAPVPMPSPEGNFHGIGFPKSLEDMYGPVLLKKAHPVLKDFLARQHTRLTQILKELGSQPESEKIRRRISEIKEKLIQNEEAFHILEGNKK